MLGNIINASILGKIGIIVTLKKDFYEDAKRICKYLEGAFKVEKSEHDPSNVIVIEYEDLKKILSAICSSEHNRHTGATNNLIGAVFGGVSYSAISKTYQRMLERLQTDRELRKKKSRYTGL